MAYPTTFRLNTEQIYAHTPSIGSSPIASCMRIPFRCEILKFGVVTNASITSTDCVVTVALSGSTVTSTGSSAMMTIPVSAASAGQVATGVPLSRCYANEDDFLTFTPASASGSSVSAQLTAIIRAL